MYIFFLLFIHHAVVSKQLWSLPHSPTPIAHSLSILFSFCLFVFFFVVVVLHSIIIINIMESQQQQQQQTSSAAGNEVDGGGSGKGGASMQHNSRQSSTRWTPTTDQIRILKDLYYNNGIRSPSAEQIQRISARLRQYGKIEGKNVFYWFQNHKARERQKKRFTSESHHLHNHLPPMQRTTNAAIAPPTSWKPVSEDQPLLHTHNKFSNIPSTGLSSASASASSAEIVAVGQMGNYGYGSVPMEKIFRECTISAGCSSGPHNVGSTGINNHHHHHHLEWVGSTTTHVDPYSSSVAYANFFDKIRPSDQEEEQEYYDVDDDDTPEIETLPLFPMHNEDNMIHGGGGTFCKSSNSSYNNYDRANNYGWYHHHQAADHQGHEGFIYGSRSTTTSLELTLNSYTRRSPDYAS